MRSFITDGRAALIDHEKTVHSHQYGEFGTDARAESIDHSAAIFDHSYGEFGFGVDGRAESIDHGPDTGMNLNYGEFGVDGRAESIDHEATVASASLSYGEFGAEFGVDGRSNIDHGPSTGFAHQYGEFGFDKIPANIPTASLVQVTAQQILRGRQEGADYAKQIYENPNLKSLWGQVVDAVRSGVPGVAGQGTTNGDDLLNEIKRNHWRMPNEQGGHVPTRTVRHPTTGRLHYVVREPDGRHHSVDPRVVHGRPEQFVRGPHGRPIVNAEGAFVRSSGGGYGHGAAKAWGWGTGPNDIKVNRAAFESLLKQRNALARKYDLNRFEIAHLQSEAIPRPTVLYIIAATSGGPSFTGDATAAPPFVLTLASPPSDVMSFQSLWNQAGGTPPLPVDGVFTSAVAAAKRLWDCGTYGGAACQPEFGFGADVNGCGVIGPQSTSTQNLRVAAVLQRGSRRHERAESRRLRDGRLRPGDLGRGRSAHPRRPGGYQRRDPGRARAHLAGAVGGVRVGGAEVGGRGRRSCLRAEAAREG